MSARPLLTGRLAISAISPLYVDRFGRSLRFCHPAFKKYYRNEIYYILFLKLFSIRSNNKLYYIWFCIIIIILELVYRLVNRRRDQLNPYVWFIYNKYFKSRISLTSKWKIIFVCIKVRIKFKTNDVTVGLHYLYLT